MRQSEYFIPTLKELASETQIPSHQMLLRAGMVRQIGAGIFSFLPLGYKVVKKIMEILREEIDGIGGQEFLLPALNPVEIWEQTNRVEAMGDVMFHIKNRDGLVLAPTHEEIITVHARQHVKSYRDMPQIWYQIQTKFRNEPRPKSGILRGRQFIMKDSYSLDSSYEALDISYDKHFEAYKRIFDRCGLEYFIVGASSGAMGGRQSQEFMVESDAGEDVCAVCDCGYAANTEVATSDVGTVGRAFEGEAMEEFATPKAKAINDLIEQFELPEDRLAKSVVYMIDSNPVLILMRGNDELNEAKLESVFGTNNLRPADPDELPGITGANAGSIGPVNLKTKIKIVADNRLLDAGGMVSGANKDGFHFKNIDFKRDFKIDEYHDLRSVVPGEKCSKCGEPLRVVKAIELGHIFKLGTKYSEALGASFLNSEGKENPIVMGSYGIGVERVLACFLEHNYDENGIIWNKALTPYHVHLIGLNIQKFENLKDGCEKIYSELTALGFDVLYDDRNESPGVKFNDADLLGLPLQIVVGKKSFEKGNVELKNRATGDRDVIPADELVAKVQEYFAD